ncbi:MAG: beta-galactosidase [Planctomycetota bacterium]
MRCMSRWIACGLLGAAFLASPAHAQDNLVANGSFASDVDGDGEPDHWSTSGVAGMEQTLTIDMGPDGAKAVKLTCSRFVSGSPASHAMICQTEHVAVEAGQWYRLTWRAKARDMKINAAQVALSNTRQWSNAGLSWSFSVGRGWREYEHVFQATRDLPASDSRLQFWFTSTGTLWLADVVLVPVAAQRYEYHPQIRTDGVSNYIPNGSFECGAAGWGSYNPEMTTWAGNVFRLIGKIDERTAFHGRRSMRVQVVKGESPVFMWDWFDLVEEEILAPLVVHHGWIPVEQGAAYTVSCALKADQPDVPARLLVREDARNRAKSVLVGTEWQRFTMTYRANANFAWFGVGPDLTDSHLDGATMWVDALQFEKGNQATGYSPKAGMECRVTTGVTGNTFLDPDAGLRVQFTACNHTDSSATVRGTLSISDFFDESVHTEDVSLPVGAGDTVERTIGGLVKGKTGFFRVVWSPAGETAQPQNLRCMVIEPYEEADSIFGMNHAYGWPFLLQLAKQAGLTWYRDWSVKWHEVQPKRGRFDFSGTDPQIDRVIEEGLNLDIMFPFPSCDWTTTAHMAAIRKAEANDYRHRVMRYACAPNNERDFRNYIARSVRHYRNRIRHYQIFNEPVYTHYSLPKRLGYEVKDYIHWMNLAADTIRSEQEDAVIIGGMGSWASSGWTHEFVRSGGLAKVDILDLHNYPVTADPEGYEPDIAELSRIMKERGQPRPMWITEYGCYADDDPYRTPQRVGDATMSKSVWPSERAASEALVQSAAAFCSHGVRKIFLHAGTCGPINGSSAGGVFFEYGGAPRKMLPAVWALSRLLGADFEPVDTGPQPQDRRLYVFRVKRGLLAIAWTREEKPLRVTTSEDITVVDMMGNELNPRTIELTATPVYFLTDTLTPEALGRILGRLSKYPPVRLGKSLGQ